MIDSLFILSGFGEILIEKHYRRGTSRSSVSDLFWEQSTRSLSAAAAAAATSSSSSKTTSSIWGVATSSANASSQRQRRLLPLVESDFDDPEDEGLPPIVDLGGQGRFAAHVKRGDLTFVGVISRETSPLLTVEFLHRVADILTEYFGPPDEVKIKDAFSTVYQLLDEVMDGGLPLVTEPNALKPMIPPPSLLNKLAATVTGVGAVSPVLAQGGAANAPWRSREVRYVQNEIFVDIDEQVDAVVGGGDGVPVSVDVRGTIAVTARLSGMAEVLIEFEDPSVLGDVSFHPCVRVDRWEADKVVSFVPLDACTYELMRYRAAKSATSRLLSTQFAPVYCNLLVTTSSSSTMTSTTTQQQASPSNHGTGRIEIVVGARPSSQPAQDVCVKLPLPSKARFLEAKATDGSVSFNDRTCTWRVGSVSFGKSAARLTGSFHVAREQATSSMTALLEFSTNSKPLSGIKIHSLEIPNQSYNFYKGVKTTVRAGEFQVRNQA